MSIGIARLSIRHTLPVLLVIAKPKCHKRLLLRVFAAIGHIMVVEKEGVAVLDSRDRRSVHERNVPDGGLGAGNASRFAEKHIAGLHK